MKHAPVVIAVALAALLLVPAISPSQESSLEDRVSNLERRMSAVEKKLAALASPQPSEKLVFGEKWKDKANWRKLRIWMTGEEVQELMGGEPDNIARISEALEVWRYGYPSGGSLNMRNGLLESWSEP